MLTIALNLLHLTATTLQQQQLLQLVTTLQQWNKVHNLTAINDPKKILTKHILDSLTVLKFLPANGQILDVGSGAGFPGLPLAIMLPEARLVLLDKCRKKTAFIQYVIGELGLENVSVKHSRVEKFNSPSLFDVVLSRAFADLATFVKLSSHLCHQNGFWLAMKGKLATLQTEVLPDGYQLTKIEQVVSAGLEFERHLVFVSRVTQEEIHATTAS